jgi:effector-binding domain-containing protein
MKQLILIFLFIISGATMATEEPKYTVEVKTDHFEIRKYNSVLVAETKVEASFEDAGNQAFRILADYIFGNNKSKTKVEMTAPVTQQSPSEKIEMTAPVNQVKTSEGYLVQFTMPEKFNLQNIPEPNDKRVQIRELPPRRVSVYRYSGSWSESRYKEKLEEFISELKKNGVKTVGEPILARYNSPFMIWFLRRNEIWIEVSD